MKYKKYCVIIIAVLAILGAGIVTAHTVGVHAEASEETAVKSLIKEEIRKMAADSRVTATVNVKKNIADNEVKVSVLTKNPALEKEETKEVTEEKEETKEYADRNATEQLVGITDATSFVDAVKKHSAEQLSEVGDVWQASVQLVGMTDSRNFPESIADWYADNDLENLALFSLNTSKKDVPTGLTGVFNPKMIIKLTSHERYLLQKLVEAEMGTEDIYSKILVANVVLNRLIAGNMGGKTLEEVVYAKIGGSVQFAPTAMPEYWNSIEVSMETIEAVDRALAGEDYSQGALYFYAWRTASYSSEKFFSTNTTKLLYYGVACYCGPKY